MKSTPINGKAKRRGEEGESEFVDSKFASAQHAACIIHNVQHVQHAAVCSCFFGEEKRLLSPFPAIGLGARTFHPFFSFFLLALARPKSPADDLQKQRSNLSRPQADPRHQDS